MIWPSFINVLRVFVGINWCLEGMPKSTLLWGCIFGIAHCACFTMHLQVSETVAKYA